MENLYGVQELAARWHCTERTARKRMRRIGTIGHPMMCRRALLSPGNDSRNVSRLLESRRAERGSGT